MALPHRRERTVFASSMTNSTASGTPLFASAANNEQTRQEGFAWQEDAPDSLLCRRCHLRQCVNYHVMELYSVPNLVTA